MYETFERLPQQKRDAVLNASIEVFARDGYKKASTDEIVQLAGISKGSLFKYFGNKRNLFFYTFDFMASTVSDAVFHAENLEDCDLLGRFERLIMTKISLMSVYPNLFDFAVKLVGTELEEPEIGEELQTRMNTLMKNNYDKVFRDLDTTQFVPDIPAELILNIIRWTMDGLSQKYQQQCKTTAWKDFDVPGAKQEVEQYFAIFQRILYRGGQDANRTPSRADL